MAEAFEQYKQFDYKANSNLVLPRQGPSNASEPTGEPESLVGRLPGQMGDKVKVGQLPEEILQTGGSERPQFVQVDGVTLRTTIGASTQQRKRRRLNQILAQLGEQPLSEDEGGGNPNDNEAIAVVFEGSDSDDPYEDDGIPGGADDEDELDAVAFADVPAEVAPILQEDDKDSLAEQETEEVARPVLTHTVPVLLPSEITAHWLQGRIMELEIVSKADVTLHLIPKEQEILRSLAIPDLQECEAALMDLVGGVKHFDFVALLLHNRWRIHYLTRLGQAQTAAAKDNIRRQMAASTAGRVVLEELEAAGTPLEQPHLPAAPKTDAEPAVVMVDANQPMHPSAEVLNLEELSFPIDDRLHGMADVRLPAGTERIPSKDYEEIVVPERGRPRDQIPKTVDVTRVLPDWASPSFTGIDVHTLNPIQTAVAKVAYTEADCNMLVCAPTGAGKTNIAMLCMLEVLSRYVTLSGGDVKCNLNGFKIVYVSPMKALVAEQVNAFQKRFNLLDMGIKVRELTGDINLTQQEISETQVIVTTPEKWDVITRRSGERLYTQLVRLMILDEIHLLHDRRGPVLETLIIRALRQYEMTGQQIRLVGLSATLPNADDVANFMKVPLERGLFVFGPEARPVPLRQSFIGIKSKSSAKRYDLTNQICYERVQRFAGQHQVLIFCHSRKETVRTAQYMRDKAFEDGTIAKLVSEGSATKEILESEAQRVSSNDLRDLLPHGFAVHHAGLQRTDRTLVEDLFADKQIQVLVSTATLAWGVNLPAHAVIIKGTQIYSPELGSWTELPPLDVVQMMGRAGRPPYDQFGHGIIITQQSQLQYYVSLTNQQLPVESQLVSVLPEVLNAEIVLGYIQNRLDAARWLKYTYLFVRMLVAPEIYKLSPADLQELERVKALGDKVVEDDVLLQRRMDLVHAALIMLDTYRLINYDKVNGGIQTTALGKSASVYYLKPATVATLNAHLNPEMNDIELFRMFGNASEFKNMVIRAEEKNELVKLIEKVPIPVSGTLTDPATKTNVLLQSYISSLKLDGFSLQGDMELIRQNASRIMRSIFEISLRRNWAKPTELALLYSKVIERRMWGGGMTPLRQFGALNLAEIKMIEARDIEFNQYFDLSEPDVCQLVAKNQRLGSRIFNLLQFFPRLSVECFVLPLAHNLLQIDLTIVRNFRWSKRYHKNLELFWILIENVDASQIVYSDTFILRYQKADPDTEERMSGKTVNQICGEGFGEPEQLKITIPFDSKKKNPTYFIKILSDKWLGYDNVFPITLRDLIIPNRSIPPTDFLGLQPIPLSSVELAVQAPSTVSTEVSPPPVLATDVLWRCYEPYKSNPFFTSLQSQAFGTLYNSDENVIVCAAQTCGKMTMAEIAVVRLLQHSSSVLCLWISPLESTTQSRFEWLRQRFPKLNGLVVNRSAGNINSDLKLLGRSHIFVCRADHWEAVSRRWKVRKVLHKIQLCVVESIELLRNPRVGSVLEAGLSRLRYINEMRGEEAPCRIVVVGAPIANANDIADWLNVKMSNCYNFHPTIRATALDLSVNRLDIPDRQRRIMASILPVNNALTKAQDRQAIVVATSRKEARQLAVEVLLYASSQRKPHKFQRGRTAGEINERLTQLNPPSEYREKVLKDILVYGVGLLHEGMRKDESEVVKTLFKEGWLQVLIIAFGVVFDLHLYAPVVVLQDTEYWDGRKWDHYDAEMMGRLLGLAYTDAQNDSPCTALVTCKPAKHKELNRLVFEPLNLESNVDLHLKEHLLTEIVTGTIRNKQQCIDWLTWTFAYRRFFKNPNYYGLRDVSPEIMSDFISEMVERACETLQLSGCVNVGEDEVTLTPTNLGLIAVFYVLRSTTIEAFVKLTTSASKVKQLLVAITSATELEEVVPVRLAEADLLEEVWHELRNSPETSVLAAGIESMLTMDYRSWQTKCLVLLIAHLKRLPLTPDLERDMADLLVTAERCCHAMVDVLGSCQFFWPILCAVEICQMITQGMLAGQSSLYQLPYFRAESVELAAAKYGIKEATDVLNADDEARDALFAEMKLDDAQIEAIAHVCNSLPIIALTCDSQLAVSSTSLTVDLTIQRDLDEDELHQDSALTIAPYFPAQKQQQWWVLVAAEQQLLGIQKITIKAPTTNVQVQLDPQTLPQGAKTLDAVIYCLSDSYVGCDKQLAVQLLLPAAYRDLAQSLRTGKPLRLQELRFDLEKTIKSHYRLEHVAAALAEAATEFVFTSLIKDASQLRKFAHFLGEALSTPQPEAALCGHIVSCVARETKSRPESCDLISNFLEVLFAKYPYAERFNEDVVSSMSTCFDNLVLPPNAARAVVCEKSAEIYELITAKFTWERTPALQRLLLSASRWAPLNLTNQVLQNLDSIALTTGEITVIADHLSFIKIVSTAYDDSVYAMSYILPTRPVTSLTYEAWLAFKYQVGNLLGRAIKMLTDSSNPGYEDRFALIPSLEGLADVLVALYKRDWTGRDLANAYADMLVSVSTEIGCNAAAQGAAEEQKYDPDLEYDDYVEDIHVTSNIPLVLELIRLLKQWPHTLDRLSLRCLNHLKDHVESINVSVAEIRAELINVVRSATVYDSTASGNITPSSLRMESESEGEWTTVEEMKAELETIEVMPNAQLQPAHIRRLALIARSREQFVNVLDMGGDVKIQNDTALELRTRSVSRLYQVLKTRRYLVRECMNSVMEALYYAIGDDIGHETYEPGLTCFILILDSMREISPLEGFGGDWVRKQLLLMDAVVNTFQMKANARTRVAETAACAKAIRVWTRQN